MVRLYTSGGGKVEIDGTVFAPVKGILRANTQPNSTIAFSIVNLLSPTSRAYTEFRDNDNNSFASASDVINYVAENFNDASVDDAELAEAEQRLKEYTDEVFSEQVAVVNGAVVVGGRIYGAYTPEAQLSHDAADLGESTNSFATWKGAGFYELATTPIIFNKINIPFRKTIQSSTATIKIAVRDTLALSGNFQSVFAPYVIKTISLGADEISPSPNKSTTINLNEAISVGAGKYIYIFVSRETGALDYMKFSSQNVGNTRHNWLYSENADTFNNNWTTAQGQFGFYQAGVSFSFITTDSVAQNTSINPRITLPSIIYSVVGVQLNIYYDAFVLGVDKGPYPMDGISVQVVSPIGYAMERMFQVTPIAGNIGDHVITIKVFDNNKKVIANKIVTLRVINNTAPISTKNILLIGDSTLNNGNVASIIRSSFVGLGGSLPNFVGTQGVSPANHEGRGGWSFARFATNGGVFYKLSVSGVSSLSLAATYTNNGSIFGIREVNITSGAGYIKIERVSGSTTPTASGTLTRSSGTGDSSIIFSSYVTDTGNPFWLTSSLNIANYRTTTLGLGAGSHIDVVAIRLGINESFGSIKTEDDRLSVIQYAKNIIDSFLLDNPSTKIIVELPTTDGNTRGGWAANYGASNPKEDYQLNVWRIRELILKSFDSEGYNENVTVCATGCMIDRYYGYELSAAQSSERITNNENRHTNAVHPSSGGYAQLADALFPHLLKMVQ